MWRSVNLQQHQGSPPMRASSACCLMGSKVYVFGGLGCGPSNSFWSLDLILHQWERLLPGKAEKQLLPPPRSSATLCPDEVEGRVFLFGGLGSVTGGVDKRRDPGPGLQIRTRLLAKRQMFGDVWYWDASTAEWKSLIFVTNAPLARRAHTATFVTGFHHLEGGSNEDDLSLAGTIDKTATTPLKTPTAASEGPASFPASSRSSGRYMVVVGGAGCDPRGFESVYGTVWALDLAERKWVTVPTTGCVDAGERFSHTTTLLMDKLWVIGGTNLAHLDPSGVQPQRTLNDVASLDLRTLVWTRLSIEGPAMQGHTSWPSPIADDEIMVMGGRVAEEQGDEEEQPNVVRIRALNVSGEPYWRSVCAAGEAPPASTAHICVGFDPAKLDLAKLWRDRGPDLDHHAIALRGNTAPVKQDPVGSTRRLLMKAGASSSSLGAPVEKLGLNAGLSLSGVSPSALISQPPCLLFYGGFLVNDTAKKTGYGSRELYQFDCEWKDEQDEEEEEEEEDNGFFLSGGGGAASSSNRRVSSVSLARRKSTGGSTRGSRSAAANDPDTAFFRKQIEKGHLPHDYNAVKLMITHRNKQRCKKQGANSLLSSAASYASSQLNGTASQRSQQRPTTTGRTRLSKISSPKHHAHLEKGLSRSATAPATLGIAFLRGGQKSRVCFAESPAASVAGKSTTQRPHTTSGVAVLAARAEMVNQGRHTLRKLPPNTTIWAAREIFQASLTIQSPISY